MELKEKSISRSLSVLDASFLRMECERLGQSGDEAGAESYTQMLESLEYGMTRGKLGAGVFCYPFNAHADDLERPVTEYLSTFSWQSHYLDWVIVSCYLQMEAISYVRDEKVRRGDTTPIRRELHQLSFLDGFRPFIRSGTSFFGPLPRSRRKLQLGTSLFALANHALHLAYSPSALLKDCSEAKKIGCFVHPLACAVLERLVAQGVSILAFPVEQALTPHMLESVRLREVKNHDQPN